MMIYMLASAMTIAMLVGTAIALREEAERVKVQTRKEQRNAFSPFARY